MIKFISVVAVLVVVMIHPIFLFLAAAIGIPYIIYMKIDWLTSTAEKIFTPNKPSTKPFEPKPQSSEDKGFRTYEESTAREMGKVKFKKGYKDDPEWQRKTALLRKQVERADHKEYCLREGIEQRVPKSS